MQSARVDEGLEISEVVQKTGVPVRTLRYRESAGLFVSPPGRTGSGRRAYLPADVERVMFVARCRSIGMPVREIARYVALVRQGDATNDERRALLEAHRERVCTQLSETTQALAATEATIETYVRRSL